MNKAESYKDAFPALIVSRSCLHSCFLQSQSVVKQLAQGQKGEKRSQSFFLKGKPDGRRRRVQKHRQALCPQPNGFLPVRQVQRQAEKPAEQVFLFSKYLSHFLKKQQLQAHRDTFSKMTALLILEYKNNQRPLFKMELCNVGLWLTYPSPFWHTCPYFDYISVFTGMWNCLKI